MIGIIGGSGVYHLDGLTDTHWEKVSSPFGLPSDDLLFGRFNGHPIVFLPRHGRDHRLSPDSINYRANIDALKRAGVTDILSISAVGSLNERLAPGTFTVGGEFLLFSVSLFPDGNDTSLCRSRISFNYRIRYFLFADASVHGLFFYITMSGRLRHSMLIDQQPLCTVHGSYLLHFLFNTDRALFQQPKSFTRCGHPVERHHNGST